MWFAVTWSLAVEEQFYLIAPPVIRFLSSRKLVVALVSTVILAPWLRVFVFQNWPSHSFTATFLMPCRADTLGVGILLAMAWRNDQFRNFLAEHPLVLQRTLQGLFLGCAVLFWWLVHPISILKLTIGYTWMAMFFGCLLLMALSQRETWIARILRWKLLRQLGVVSYCVYIVHLALNEFAHELLLHAPPQVNNLRGVGVTLLSFALTLAVAGLSWVAFEKPLIRRGHNYKYWGGEEPKVPELVPTGAELRE
jgi:peptidoglycan/LPS O-acetylase OafA/YrhL